MKLIKLLKNERIKNNFSDKIKILVYEESYPTFERNYENGQKFNEIGDTVMACQSFKLANDEVKNHFVILQKYNSSDWFAIRKYLKAVLEKCYG